MSTCESKISTDQLVLKEPCKVEFPLHVYRQVLVTFARFPIAVTSWYKLSIEPIGFAIGRHLYSLSLTPGEEVEIEVFRSAKVERELSQQYSTEVEFMSEFSQTLRSEWSRKTTSNTKQAGGVSGKIDLGIIEFGGHYEPEYSETEEEFTKVFAEATSHAKYRVDRKFDMHVGLKTTVENRYRSTRKIRNPNACQSVTYNYFQLMRKFKITVTRISLGFDYVPVAPRILTTHIPAVIRSYEMPPLELKALVSDRDEMSQPAETSSSLTPTAGVASAKPATLSLAYVAASEQQTSSPAIKTLLHPIIEELGVLELTKERLLGRMETQKVFKNAAERKQLDGLLNNLLRKFPLRIVVKESEVCVNTNSMYVEPMVGLCLACDKHMVEMRKIELEKAKVELEKAKQEVKG